MTEEVKKKRGERGPAKVTTKKTARDAKREVDDLLDNKLSSEDMVKLLEAGGGFAVQLLVKQVLGVGDVSPTNQGVASKALLDMYFKVFGEESLRGLIDKSDKAITESGEVVGGLETKSNLLVGKFVQ